MTAFSQPIFFRMQDHEWKYQLNIRLTAEDMPTKKA